MENQNIVRAQTERDLQSVAASEVLLARLCYLKSA
jgi:hypothetical protein